MENIRYHTIYLDGIDKTGKDTIAQYVIKLCNYKYIVNCRGIITQIAYNNLYNRDCCYSLDGQQNILNVLLTVDEDDWNIRCKLTNEPKIDYSTHNKIFQDVYDTLNLQNLPTLSLNTSKMSPYQIALHIVNFMDALNRGIK